MSSSKTIVITGSTTGMGYATRQLLEQHGVRVIGVSNTGEAEVIADLSTPEGVDFAVSEIKRLAAGKLDGVFANAGVDNQNAALVFGLNYFGVIQFLHGLQSLLSASGDGRIVVNASNSVVITPEIPNDVVEALLQQDKATAMALIGKMPQWTYQVSKTAITHWVRRHAHEPEWAGSKISMNVVAPGVVLTALIEEDMKDPRKAAGINKLPKPIGELPKPEDIASLVKFLLVDDSRFIVGQYIVIDGGTEVALRGKETPKTWDISIEAFRKL